MSEATTPESSKLGAPIDFACINAIRTLSIDAVQQANSGHPGLPMGAAPMAYVLWSRHLNVNPANPDWADRDRFVLSAGHGSMLLYALLHLAGYDLSLDEVRNFRQWDSKTPGHPEFAHTPGVEATTGPLGQGTANAAGMAVAERMLAHLYNQSGAEIVDHFTYALVSDGDIMEGISAEVGSLAGHLGLGKLIYLYDANDISLDGPTSLSFTEDTAKRYESYGWHVETVADGDTDLAAIDAAITAAKAETARPSLIVVKTTIGYGSPNKAGSESAHGAPLGEDEVRLTKEALGVDASKTFDVPDEVRAHFGVIAERGREAEAAWSGRFDAFAKARPDLAEQWKLALAGELPEKWDAALPNFPAGESVATRGAGGKALNALAARVPYLVGGDADLSCSTKAKINDGGLFDGATGAGRNVAYGVREHAMAAMTNGICYHGGLRAFTSTFFCFADYMRPGLRLAAMNGLAPIYVWTHDSVAVGEDGPTHQPIEHLMSLRAIPNLWVVRPGDANETAEAWRMALERTDGPTAIVLTRQGIPVFDRARFAAAEETARGAYILSDPMEGGPQAIVMATGSEVHLAVEAQAALAKDGIAIRVVSMPCWEAFEAQDAAYREKVLPGHLTARVSVEAGATLGWERYTGTNGRTIGIDRYGASAPYKVNLEKFGFTVERIVEAVREVLG